MSSWGAALLSVMAAVNPAAAARLVGWDRKTGREPIGAIVALAAACLVVGVLLSGPLLDLLDVSVPTFRLAAAVVYGLAGAKLMIWLPAAVVQPPSTVATVAVIALTGLAAPGAVFASVAAAADAGTIAGLVSVGLALAAATALLLRHPAGAVLDIAARFTGASAVALAIVIGIDAARTV